jgi:hypothetical protein
MDAPAPVEAVHAPRGSSDVRRRFGGLDDVASYQWVEAATSSCGTRTAVRLLFPPIPVKSSGQVSPRRSSPTATSQATISADCSGGRRPTPTTAKAGGAPGPPAQRRVGPGISDCFGVASRAPVTPYLGEERSEPDRGEGCVASGATPVVAARRLQAQRDRRREARCDPAAYFVTIARCRLTYAAMTKVTMSAITAMSRAYR